MTTFEHLVVPGALDDVADLSEPARQQEHDAALPKTVRDLGQHRRPAHVTYSGSATYAVEVDLPATRRAVLDLGPTTALDEGGSPQRGMVGPAYRVASRGPVGEIAQVRVNGVDCGVAWAPPYRVDVTGAVRAGANTVEVVVHNAAANALSADPTIGPLIRATEERYGRRFVMQQLDRALDDVASGLLAVPTIAIEE